MPNFGTLYIMLKSSSPIRSVDEDLQGRMPSPQRLQESFNEQVPTALVNVFGAPPVDGLGTAGGFKLRRLASIQVAWAAPNSKKARSRSRSLKQEEQSRTERYLHWIPSRYALVIPRYRSRCSPGSRRTGRRNHQCPSSVPWLALCERLQSFWQDLAGERPGRIFLSTNH